MKMSAEAIRAHAMKHGLPCALDAVSAVMPQQPEPDSAPTKFQRGEERKLNELVCAELRRRGIPHVVARTDRESTIKAGWPDITAVKCGKCALVELKAEGGRLSEAQRLCHAELAAAGVPVCVAFDFDTAVRFILNQLDAIP